MSGIELMSVDDVLNALGLQGVLFYFLAPTIIIILGVYAGRMNKRNKKLREERDKKMKEASKEGVKVLENDEMASKVISEVADKPDNIEKFRGLALEFDENGHVK